MKTLRVVIVVSLISLVFVLSGTAHAQGYGARAIAMGGAYVALANDPFAISWNPAGLSFLKPISFGFESRLTGSSRWNYSDESLSYEMGQTHPVGVNYLGTSFSFQNATVGFAYGLPQNSGSLTYNYAQSGGSGSFTGNASGGTNLLSPAIAFRFDNAAMGIAYTNFSGESKTEWSDGERFTRSPAGDVLTVGLVSDFAQWRLGAVVQAYLRNDLSGGSASADSSSYYSFETSLNKPIRGVVGFGLTSENVNLTFDYDVQGVEGATPTHFLKTGIEIPMRAETMTFALRAGYQQQVDKVNKSASAGIGFTAGSVSIDAAYRYGYDNAFNETFQSNFVYLSAGLNLDIIAGTPPQQVEPGSASGGQYSSRREAHSICLVLRFIQR